MNKWANKRGNRRQPGARGNPGQSGRPLKLQVQSTDRGISCVTGTLLAGGPAPPTWETHLCDTALELCVWGEEGGFRYQQLLLISCNLGIYLKPLIVLASTPLFLFFHPPGGDKTVNCPQCFSVCGAFSSSSLPNRPSCYHVLVSCPPPLSLYSINAINLCACAHMRVCACACQGDFI